MTLQKVDVTAGGIEYTWPLTMTETTGKDITGCTVELSLGTYDDPGDWLPPDTEYNPTTSSVTVQILVDDTYPVGTYYLWRSIHDAPEVIPKRTGHRVQVL